ncbi:hypothetical protein A0O36_02469 [Piscirickettsiaceae bacterium NZ-RLO1]|nr:hypothetical protein A0O36_02469 [Piscirickettsiaceae bacterium NZ-RLO1]
MKEKYTHPVELLIHSTTRIMSETSTGLISTGTGYYFNFAADGGNSIPCIVTNKHVVHGAVKGKFCLNKKNSDGSIDLGGHISLEFSNFESRWVKHPDANIDLAVFPIGPILHQAGRQNIVVHYTPLGERNIADANLLNTLPTMEDIIMIGYPNGIWDEKHNLPIIRRGITATHPKLPYNGKPEFLIDAACFPGSSGSPVF